MRRIMSPDTSSLSISQIPVKSDPSTILLITAVPNRLTLHVVRGFGKKLISLLLLTGEVLSHCLIDSITPMPEPFVDIDTSICELFITDALEDNRHQSKTVPWLKPPVLACSTQAMEVVTNYRGSHFERDTATVIHGLPLALLAIALDVTAGISINSHQLHKLVQPQRSHIADRITPCTTYTHHSNIGTRSKRHIPERLHNLVGTLNLSLLFALRLPFSHFMKHNRSPYVFFNTIK